MSEQVSAAKRVVGVRVAAAIFVLVTLGLVVGRAVGWVPFSWLEIVASVTGAACVLLVVARSVWNFPLGIISCVAYVVFFAQGRLFAEAGLQVVFILLSLHGWWFWRRSQEAMTARRVPLGELTAIAAIVPGAWFGLTWLLEYLGGAAPMMDAFVTVLSLAAQWMLNRRYIESWLGWIIVDQVSVVLFWTRDMQLTAGLYALFLGMCVAGLIEWRSHLERSPA
ncbi:MAG: nicotinamide riboside transporter PnuC [Fimbriiglobus sp.]